MTVSGASRTPQASSFSPFIEFIVRIPFRHRNLCPYSRVSTDETTSHPSGASEARIPIP